MKNVMTSDIVEVSFEGRCAGQTTLNLLHYMITDAPIDGIDWNGFALALKGQIDNPAGMMETYLACCSDEFTLRSLRIQVIKQFRYSYEHFDLDDEPGTVVQEALPPNDAVVITKRNDSTGRHARGSIHMPGVPRTFVANGEVLPVGRAAYDLFATEAAKNQAVTVLSATLTLAPVIYNRLAPGTSQRWNQWITQATSRVQRRRTVGLGV